jgi:multidrug efflux pump subunit AcrB
MGFASFDRLLHRPVAVSMFYGALVVGGIFAFTHLPLELAPAKEFPRLSVYTSWSSASPETVEMFITSPIEEIANTVTGVRKVNSTSEEGTSTVDVEFAQEIDMNFARLELSEKLAAFAEGLPPGLPRSSVTCRGICVTCRDFFLTPCLEIDLRMNFGSMQRKRWFLYCFRCAGFQMFRS